MLDRTHDANLTCWVASANCHDQFPIQNLPFGVFAFQDARPRGGIAIGDSIVDLAKLAECGALTGEAKTAVEAASETTLNRFFALGSTHRRALRNSVSQLLSTESAAALPGLVRPAEECSLHLPLAIGDYTDFYAGIHHALTVGKLFRPDAPLLPNYKHVPIAYHGRASSVRVSGSPIRRPKGQIKTPDAPPVYDLSQRLDFELELGIWVGEESLLGQPISISQAADHVAGYCLLNDWSARDVQTWEYQPLGPFLAKNFLTSVSPWIVTPEALQPFRIPQAPRPVDDPKPLPYLWDDADQFSGALDIALEVYLATAAMRRRGSPPERISLSNSRHLYWTVAQMLAHHTSSGCNLRPGDLLGSGTISADVPSGCGSLLELGQSGKRPIQLANGEKRAFLEDGDEIILKARAERTGFASIGFGECRGVILAG